MCSYPVMHGVWLSHRCVDPSLFFARGMVRLLHLVRFVYVSLIPMITFVPAMTLTIKNEGKRHLHPAF